MTSVQLSSWLNDRRDEVAGGYLLDGGVGWPMRPRAYVNCGATLAQTDEGNATQIVRFPLEDLPLR